MKKFLSRRSVRWMVGTVVATPFMWLAIWIGSSETVPFIIKALLGLCAGLVGYAVFMLVERRFNL